VTVDPRALWDFGDPAGSEQRFRAALAGADGDDALVLQTQIARTYGLRGRFAEARALLEALAPQLAAAGPEAVVHHRLELGRTLRSATGGAGEDAEAARAAFLEAAALARAAGLDALQVDAIHMLAFVDDDPAVQLEHARAALAIAHASPQPDARAWSAGLHNNAGMALHALGRYDEALAEFEAALRLRQSAGDAEAIRIAWWTIAWTYRALGRRDEALAIQERLAAECEAAAATDPYVLEELALLRGEAG
jgi:tetratricopeptide (TPR) repeat protein